MRSHGDAPPVVRRGYGPYDEAAHLHAHAGLDLREPQVREPAQAGHRAPGPSREQDQGAGGEPGQGRDVQVVGVQMRDEDDVGDGGLGRGAPRGAGADGRGGV